MSNSAEAYVVRAVTITDANLTASNIPEDDAPAFALGNDFAVGEKAIFEHRVWECGIAVTNATLTPPEDPEHWVADPPPTNRFALFDDIISTRTVAADEITFTVAPGRVDSITLMQVDADEFYYKVEVDGQTIKEETIPLTTRAEITNWYSWTMEPFYTTNFVARDGLIDGTLLNLPAFSGAVITVSLRRPGGQVGCGLFKCGLTFYVGETLNKPKIGIVDYSRRTYNFGVPTVNNRAYGKKLNATIRFPTSRLDSVFFQMAELKDEPLVWFLVKDHGAFLMYGLSTWDITRDNALYSSMPIEVIGNI